MTLAPELASGLIARAARPDFPRFEAQLRSSGYCVRPVRLQGHVEVCEGGRRRRVWSTDIEPDEILRKACGNRREAVCPPCAERYRGDAYHLTAAGLRGGKGVPETVAEHPAVFVTFTAPSFGLVHMRPLGSDGEPRRCRPRRDAPVCEHGVRLSCGVVHGEDDPRLGEPICLDCFDHEGAVAWNNALGELWRRTVPVYLPRRLARHTGMTQERLRGLVRVRYVKVTEYQRRGLVHVHAVIRLDRAMPAYRAHEIKPPPPGFTTELLEHAIRDTAGEVYAPLPDDLGGGTVRWGEELDVRQLDSDQRREVAGYLAKYATKSTEQAGGLLHRIEREDIETAPVREHVRRYLRAAFRLDDACQATAKRRAAAGARRRPAPPAAETARDGNLLAWRAAQAMSRCERVRIRLCDGATHVGRIVRWSPNRTPADLALDTGQVLPIAEVKVIATAQRGPRDQYDRRLAKCAHAHGYRGHSDQEPPVLHDLHRAPRSARAARARAAPRPVTGRDATRPPRDRRERADRQLPVRRSRPSHNCGRVPGRVGGRQGARAAPSSARSARNDGQWAGHDGKGGVVQIDDARVTGGEAGGGAIEPMMTADEVAAALGVHRKFVYARVHAGVLRGYKLGSQYRFRPEDVRAFVEASLAPADPAPQVRERPRRVAPAGTFRALLEGRAA